MTNKSTPTHVAIVMDGNGRWASKRFLPRIAGHKQGVDALKRCARACDARGIKVLTVFAFSSENWQRPQEEVSGLMDLFALALGREVPQLKADGVQLRFIGERQGLSARVLKGIEQAEAATAANQQLVLNVCFNYGGRWDICQAAESLRSAGRAITEESLSKSLALAHVTDPDLFIRTGGELRVSNFLIWQMAYAEFYFSQVLWPDFGAEELDHAITVFRSRERRFGQTSEQVVAKHNV